MPYVKRNEQNKVVGLYARQQSFATEFLPDDDVEVQDYLNPPALPKTQFTPLEFMERFTDQEQLDLSGAALSDPQVKLFYDKMLAAKEIDLNDQRTQGGVNLLVSKNLISQARANQILTAE